MDRMLSVETMMKLDKPSPRQGRMIFPSSFIFRTFSFRMVCFPVRNFRIHTALTAWLRTVASAAPETPKFSTKMKMGSRMMLITAPMTVVIMLILAKPWVVTKVFMPITTSTNTLPRM